MYGGIVGSINQSMGRQVITEKKLRGLIQKAKEIRRAKGTSALIEYAGRLPNQFLNQEEVERFKRTRDYPIIANQMVDLLASEQVISPFEAMMLRRYI